MLSFMASGAYQNIIIIRKNRGDKTLDLCSFVDKKECMSPENNTESSASKCLYSIISGR